MNGKNLENQIHPKRCSDIENKLVNGFTSKYYI